MGSFLYQVQFFFTFFTILNLFVVFCCCCCFASFLSTTSGLNLKLFSFSIFHFHVFCFKETDNFFYYISVFSRREKILFQKMKNFIELLHYASFRHYFFSLFSPTSPCPCRYRQKQAVSQSSWLAGWRRAVGRQAGVEGICTAFFALSLLLPLLLYTTTAITFEMAYAFFPFFSENFFSCVKFCRLLNYRFMNTTRYYF